MTMSPSDAALELLHRVADEVREAFSERHYKIATAISSDSAFSADRRPLSALVRALVVESVKVGSSRAGIAADTLAGGALELLRSEGNSIHHFRLRTATRDQDGSVQIIVNGDPAEDLRSGEVDGQGTFIVDEHWVLGFMYDEEGFIQELFTAKILGVTDTKVMKLLLGPAIPLGTSANTPPPSHGFQPADEDDLDGFETEAEDDFSSESA